MSHKKRTLSYCVILPLLVLSGLLGVVSWAKLHHYGLVNQTSASMPRGWYVSLPIKKPLERNQIVLFTPTPWVEKWMRTRGWILPKAQMMKHVVGVPGDLVCRKGKTLWLNHHAIATIFRVDSQQRPLPHLRFCRYLRANEYWLMSFYAEHSFDSRYFGPVLRNQIHAIARPL